MCNFEKGFILCTCKEPKPVIHNKNSRRYKRMKKEKVTKISYHWTLYRFIGIIQFTMDGIYYFPTSDIGNGLTVQDTKDQLNRKNCFDFEYTPNEGDNLQIRREDSYSDYLDFIYRKNEWVEESYTAQGVERERIFNGWVKET